MKKYSGNQNQYTGKWEAYYGNGNPEITFEMMDAGELKVTNLWDSKGVKLDDNGNGDYHVNMGSIIWQGKLKDGVPDGAWTAASRNDISTVLITENFKNGKFQRGKSQAGSYTDASRIVLIDANIFPYSVAEQLSLASGGCNVVKQLRIVNAKFLLSAAIRLQKLTPATVNGKPVEQGIKVTFSFYQGLYHFSYTFLPIKSA